MQKKAIRWQKLRISQLCLIASLTLLFSDACIQETNTPVVVRTGVSCTMLGCRDALSVHIDGDLPDDYVIEMRDTEDKVAAILCLWDNRTAFEDKWPVSSGIANQFYALDSPEIGEISAISSFSGLCDSRTGLAAHTVGTLANGGGDFVEWIVVQCFEPSTDLLLSECDPKGAQVYGFAPEELFITIRWDGNVKTELIHPAYSISRPNGPYCEPECRWADVNITLP